MLGLGRDGMGGGLYRVGWGIEELLVVNFSGFGNWIQGCDTSRG